MMVVLPALLALTGGALIAAGLALMAGGALGLLRFPDFYTRLHAVHAADGVGGVLFVLGLALVCGDPALALRLVLLALLMAALAPTLSHVWASAAHAAGLAPLAGRYTAPRPEPRSGRPT